MRKRKFVAIILPFPFCITSELSGGDILCIDLMYPVIWVFSKNLMINMPEFFEDDFEL